MSLEGRAAEQFSTKSKTSPRDVLLPGPLGDLLGASWGPLGGPLGSVAAGKPLVGLLGASWGPLGGLSKTIEKPRVSEAGCQFEL